MTQWSARSLTLLPAGISGVVIAVAWAAQATAHVSLPASVATALICWGFVLVVADRRGQAAAAAARAQQEREPGAADHHFTSLLAKAGKIRGSVAWASEQVQKGLTSADVPLRPDPTETGDAYAEAQQALEYARWEVVRAVFGAAAHQHELVNTEREHSDILLAIAGRLQALVSRAIESISAVESDIEDPDQLDQVFRVDHLTTQIGRAVESIAVLGGRMPSRAAEPLPVSAAMRHAVAETEQYARVRVLLPHQDQELPGYAAPGVVHLLAELIANATAFFPPHTAVLLRTMAVPAGLAIEVEDHGLPMSPAKLDAMNRLLADPHTVDRRAQNDLGLLAEEYDPVQKRQLGNFPQAFSHMGLIQSALLLQQLATQSSSHRGAVAVPAPRSPSCEPQQNRKALTSQHA